MASSRVLRSLRATCGPASRRREVPPLAPSVVCELKAHYSRSVDHSSGALISATGQGAPLSADNLSKKSLRTACRRAGLPRIDWHTLRHTHGTLLHSQGTPLKVAQAQLLDIRTWRRLWRSTRQWECSEGCCEPTRRAIVPKCSQVRRKWKYGAGRTSTTSVS